VVGRVWFAGRRARPAAVPQAWQGGGGCLREEMPSRPCAGVEVVGSAGQRGRQVCRVCGMRWGAGRWGGAAWCCPQQPPVPTDMVQRCAAGNVQYSKGCVLRQSVSRAHLCCMQRRNQERIRRFMPRGAATRPDVRVRVVARGSRAWVCGN